MFFAFLSFSGARSSSRSVCLRLSALTALLYNPFFLPLTSHWQSADSTQMSAGKHTSLFFYLEFLIPPPPSLFPFHLLPPSHFRPPPSPLSAPYSLAIRDWFSPLSLCFHWSAFISPGQFPHISTQGQGRRADTHCLPWPMDPACLWKMSFGEAINCIQFKDEGRNKFLFSEVWRNGRVGQPPDNFSSIIFMWKFLWNVHFVLDFMK